MKKIRIKGVEEDIFYEKLDNGLEVYLYTKDTVHSNYVTFTTKYGSVYNEFVPINSDKMTTFPKGIAHFLEHKVFAQKEDPQPMEFFARSGAVCNAYTTFKNTTYLFYATESLKENIEYLLDYVQNIYLTDESVENEKDIISEEIHMYDDRPMSILEEKVRKNTLKTNPYKDRIIGTTKDIRSITKEDLETCYHTFYHPSNMFIVITGNFNPDEALAIISENQINKKFEKPFKIEVKKKKEKASVVKEKEVVKCNVEIDKVSIGIKVPLEELNDIKLKEEEISVYVNMILNASFGRSSELRERLVSGNIITNGIFYDSFKTEDYLIINIISETPYPERYISIIKEKINDLSDIDNELTRKSRVAISSLIFALDNIETMNEMIVDNIVEYGHVVPNYYDIYKSLDLRKINKVGKIITKSPMSVLTLTKKVEES